MKKIDFFSITLKLMSKMRNYGIWKVGLIQILNLTQNGVRSAEFILNALWFSAKIAYSG